MADEVVAPVVVEKDGIKYVEQEFEKVGKRPTGVAAEKYKALQLVEVIPYKDDNGQPDVELLISNILKVANGDAAVAAEMFTRGANSVLKSLAGESDEASKAARLLFKMGVTFGTETPQALAAAIREGKISAAV